MPSLPSSSSLPPQPSKAQVNESIHPFTRLSRPWISQSVGFNYCNDDFCSLLGWNCSSLQHRCRERIGSKQVDCPFTGDSVQRNLQDWIWSGVEWSGVDEDRSKISSDEWRWTFDWFVFILYRAGDGAAAYRIAWIGATQISAPQITWRPSASEASSAIRLRRIQVHHRLCLCLSISVSCLSVSVSLMIRSRDRDDRVDSVWLPHIPQTIEVTKRDWLWTNRRQNKMPNQSTFSKDVNPHMAKKCK